MAQDVLSAATLLDATVNRLRRTIQARLDAGHETLTLNRQDAQILANLLGHLSEQQDIISSMWAKLQTLKKTPSKVSGLPAVVEEIPEKLALPTWAKNV